jgi:hypothetical protein
MRTLEFMTGVGKMGNGKGLNSHLKNCQGYSSSLIVLFSAFRHGKGKWTNTNGDYYDGDFVYEKRHGYGTYTWPNGDAYKGDFADDNRNGKVGFIGTERYQISSITIQLTLISSSNIFTGRFQIFKRCCIRRGVPTWSF